jgi:hypothetical protein
MHQVIELQEQAPSPVFLTDAEAQELRALKVDVQNGAYERQMPGDGGTACRVYLVNPRFQVGHFRLSADARRTVSIRPKVGIRNVFSLLGVAYGFYSGQTASPFRSDQT